MIVKIVQKIIKIYQKEKTKNPKLIIASKIFKILIDDFKKIMRIK